MNDSPIFNATYADHVNQAFESEDEALLQTLADLDAATDTEEQK